ncbi:hypothetical protein L6R52_11425 [Myxococcota bacterium]|nr:hypothetical protein [Myxococcota bacterium]
MTTKRTIHTLTSATALAALMLGACGGDGPDTTTFTGRLTAPAGSEAHLAILWFPQSITGDEPIPGPGGGDPDPTCTGEPGEPETERVTIPTIAWASQSARSTGTSGAFTLAMDGAPPEAVRFDLSTVGGSGHLSAGVVVAYDDADGDGAFDQGVPGDAGDAVLGVSAEGEGSTMIVHLDGTLPAELTEGLRGPLPQGYSLLVFDAETGEYAVQPLSAGIDLAVAAPDSEESGVMRMFYGCRSVELAVTSGGLPPDGAALECSATGDAFSWQTEPTYSACAIEMAYGSACLDEGQSPGAGWPCSE